MRVLITGAKGALGQELMGTLGELGHDVFGTDLHNMDVRVEKHVATQFNRFRPDLVYHLAGLKLAVDGELEPDAFARTNVQGTANVVRACGVGLARVPLVFASTCKAADPETAYGASKLIAERVVLNRGHTVVRLFNIPECGPSVFSTWRELPGDQAIPFTDCWRYFIPVEQAVEALIYASGLPAGRYAPNPGQPRHMRHVARELYPDRELVEIPRRRGDRRKEPLHAACEYAVSMQGLLRISNPHDPETIMAEAVAA